MRAEMEEEDSLDAYMASLEIPTAQDHTSMAQARDAVSSAGGRLRTAPHSGSDVAVKNRRYRRLQQLLLPETSVAEEDRYFSDSLMQQRSPALFHFYLGQYLGVQRGATTDTNAAPVAPSPMDSSTFSLSSFLMDTCQRNELEARRIAEQECWGDFQAADVREEQRRQQRLFEEDEVEEEEEDEEDEEDEEGKAEDPAVVSLSKRRKQLVEVMSVRFLHGEDAEYVNYAEIDADETLDDLEQMQRDAEERYFADDWA